MLVILFACGTAEEAATIAPGIARVVETGDWRIQTCIEAAQRWNPKTAGEVAVGWMIEAGKVTEVHEVRNTTGDVRLTTCFSNSVRSQRFAEDTTAEVAEYAWVVTAPSPGTNAPRSGEREP